MKPKLVNLDRLRDCTSPEVARPQVIGIRFGDNDFANVGLAFCRALYDADKSESFTREQIVALWNLSAPGLYWVHQNLFRSERIVAQIEGRPAVLTDLEKAHARITAYLQIDASRVYLDEEVADYLLAHGSELNSEFWAVDRRIPRDAPPPQYALRAWTA